MSLINLTMYHVPSDKFSEVFSSVEFIAGQPSHEFFPGLSSKDIRIQRRYILVESLNDLVKYHIRDKGYVNGEVFEKIIGERIYTQEEMTKLRNKETRNFEAGNSPYSPFSADFSLRDD